MQIAESVAGRRRIVRHVGSARDEAELGLLMEEALRLLEDDRQGVLDLGITPQARQAVMVRAPGQPVLFSGETAPGPRPAVPRARTLKTASVDVGALPCRPCDQRACAPGDFRCLTTITAAQVAAAAESLLESR